MTGPSPAPRILFRALGLAALGLLAPAHVPEARAWPAPAYRNMVYDALRMMPPSLARVLLRNEEHLVAGAARLEPEAAARLVRDGRAGRLSAETIADLERRVAGVAAMVAEHRPFREIAFELGKLLRFGADLADPSIVGGDPWLGRAAVEYHRFVLDHLDRFPLVHDEALPSTVAGTSLDALAAVVAEASRRAADRLGRAFWQDGRLRPASSFDFRSVPYAEASLAYSRAVTAASYLWLAAWSRANGDFTGYRFFPRGARARRPDAGSKEKKER